MNRTLATVFAGLSLAAVALTGCTPGAADDTPPAADPTPSTPSAPTAATPTANPTTAGPSATAPASAQPSQAAGLPDLVQRYCTDTAKVCVMYPKGYVIVKDPNPLGIDQPTNTVHIADPSGKPVVYIYDGPSAGEAAGQVREPIPRDVLSAQPTKLTLKDTVQTNQGVYATRMVTQNDKGWAAEVFLTVDSRFGKPGLVADSNGILPDKIQLDGGRAVRVSANNFGSGHYVYSSREEARTAASTMDAQLAYAIMLTASNG